MGRLRDALLSGASAAIDTLRSPSPSNEVDAQPLVKAGDPDSSQHGSLDRAPASTLEDHGDHVKGDTKLQIPVGGGRAILVDPQSFTDQLGYKDRASSLSYDLQRTLVYRVPVLQAVIHTRVNQIAAFCRPQKHKFEPGYRVALRDEEARPTAADRRFMVELERAILSTGVRKDARTADNFETFIRKIAYDSLTIDQCGFEVLKGRDGRPSQMYAVDGASLRLANSYYVRGGDERLELPRVLQMINEAPVATFDWTEMAWGVRNPRTDLQQHGYGVSEVEMLLVVLTDTINSLNHNRKFFENGVASQGILNIADEDWTRDQLQEFRSEFVRSVVGPRNAWRTPMTNAKKLEWISFMQSNRDMEFSSWVDFLIKLIAAIYQMDPIEVNFKYGAGNQKSVFESGNKAKLVESRDKGLRPLLKFLADLIDMYFVRPINEEFKFTFVGLDSQTPKELADLNTQRVRSIYTIDEVRAENDLPPLPDNMGALIMDANWLALWKLKQDADMFNIQQGQQGQPATDDQKQQLEALMKPQTKSDFAKALQALVTVKDPKRLAGLLDHNKTATNALAKAMATPPESISHMMHATASPVLSLEV